MKAILRFLQTPAFRSGFLVLALAAAVFAVVKNWDEVSASLLSLPPWQIVVQVLLGFGYVYLTMGSWRVVLNDVGDAVSPRIARRIFFSSQVAKYLPGGVWNFVAAAEVGRDYSISRRRSVCALVVSIMISILTGTLLAGLAVLMGTDQVHEQYGWVVILIPFAFVVLCPPVLNRIVNVSLKLLRRPPLESEMSWGGTGRSALWALAAWLLIGLQLWLILTSLGTDANASTFFLATGGYSLGWIAGFLVFFVPAGAGVREVALGAVLSTVATQGVVVVVVLLTRLFTTLADIGWGVSASIQMRRDARSSDD